jgi:hypothetical protein
MSEQTFVSLLPADAVESTGLPLDDADVILKSARFEMWNYNGQQAAGPALHIVFIDGEDKSHDQYYSAGKAEKSVPSDDGKYLLPTGDQKGLNKATKAFAFLASLFNADAAGINALLADGDVSKLDGLRAHIIAVADKDKDGTVIKNAKGYDRTTLVVSKIIALPGQKPGGAKKGAATPAAKTTTAAPAAGGGIDPALDAKAAGYLLQILAERGGSVAKKEVPTLVFQAANNAKDADKAKLTTLVFKKEFLEAHPEFTVENDAVSMAA